MSWNGNTFSLFLHNFSISLHFVHSVVYLGNCCTFRFYAVFISSGCHDKHHSLGGLNNQNLFLTVLEAQSPRPRCQQVWVLMRALFLAYRQLHLHHVLTWPFLRVHGEGERGRDKSKERGREIGRWVHQHYQIKALSLWPQSLLPTYMPYLQYSHIMG